MLVLLLLEGIIKAINLDQIYSNINIKKNIVSNTIDLHFFIYNNTNLNAVVSIDIFHSNSRNKDGGDPLSQIYTINLDKEEWNFKIGILSSYDKKIFSGRSIISTNNKLYSYGGLLLDLSTNFPLLTNNFRGTVFNYTKYLYLEHKLNSHLPPNAFHTATMINSTTIVVLGGVSYSKFYDIKLDSTISSNAQIYYGEPTIANLRYAYLYTLESEISERIETTNYDNRVRAGHSATYLSNLNCILVYGGANKPNDYTILYNDIQLLNLNSWEWTKINIIDLNNEIFNVGRAWHSSELVGNKLVFFYGDIDYEYNNDKKHYIIAIDLQTLDLDKKTVKMSNIIGPAIKKSNEVFSEFYTTNEYLSYSKSSMDDLSYYYNSSGIDEIVGISIGVILLLLVIYGLYYYYKRIKQKKSTHNNIIISSPSLDSLKLSHPNGKDGDKYGIWELNSHYTNSSISDFGMESNRLDNPIVLHHNITISSSNKATKINLSEGVIVLTNDSTVNNTNSNLANTSSK
ncbi:hypothetical protein K502DRAFT_368814 [Neoconidiobolus thromboides FSU 785]|nr:hypothetical protein K502DRAFT_368814 [Neoconidiobolus thromboides FSU 785]